MEHKYRSVETLTDNVEVSYIVKVGKNYVKDYYSDQESDYMNLTLTSDINEAKKYYNNMILPDRSEMIEYVKEIAHEVNGSVYKHTHTTKAERFLEEL